MHSVIYVSKVADQFDERQLEDLVDQAAAINAKNGLTGMLVYNGKNFMQLLEGKQRRVEQTLERIARDERHSDLVVIRQLDDRPRECPDWSMRSFTVPLTVPGSADVVAQSLPEGFEMDSRAIFTSFASMA
ncbi:Sensors of blue-light using FAD [Parasphingorhabdus marina DSM 22363]|uniref:Sensors of blue-light using FAD n=1 Tax=Parasphingorhabdus marina DSM 22363 TaxID=1123272 RepID=A0A1N6F5Z2_9SPHN|nr:BLUF domain-containing protein [Parasphingorhabdus marina]SIN90718.1 Sensors of blue-light using FAD [Parasphingorhabdus marina DSM 22363]